MPVAYAQVGAPVWITTGTACAVRARPVTPRQWVCGWVAAVAEFRQARSRHRCRREQSDMRGILPSGAPGGLTVV